MKGSAPIKQILKIILVGEPVLVGQVGYQDGPHRVFYDLIDNEHGQ